ncbi:hypothetical protein, partial [Parabacteroides distasonis]|uniref:hypothetical protein n=1 Tax=Parabacteroides distasonis TaxID=823 RepID=UPI00321BC123
YDSLRARCRERWRFPAAGTERKPAAGGTRLSLKRTERSYHAAWERESEAIERLIGVIAQWIV